jgi:outer membrane protein TolC
MTDKRCFLGLAALLVAGLLAMGPSACAPGRKGSGQVTRRMRIGPETAGQVPKAAGEKPGAAASKALSTEPLRITVGEAVLLCLENNRSLAVQRLQPEIQYAYEDQERAVFDPVLSAEILRGQVRGERLPRTGSETETYTEDTVDGAISLEKYFPTGTSVALEAGVDMTDSSLYDETLYTSRLGLTVTQALLRGLGPAVNRVRLQQAQLATRFSEYELRGFTESLVAEVERTYWDYALARRQIEIVEQSLSVARQQRHETEQLIAVGRLAKSELAAVQAEVAAQQQRLIEAQASREGLKLKLLHLLNPPGDEIWQRKLELIHQPVLPDITLEAVEQYVAVAMRMRPVLNQARLDLLHGELELVKTRNGLLPLMDLFVALGRSGYASAFGESISNIDGNGHDYQAGIRLAYPLSNRDAGARHRQALLMREQAEGALENLSQLVEVDVRSAYIEVDRTKKQIAASSVTRRFDEEKLRTETEKLRVGKSTSFLVAQAQRDLLISRIIEVQAIVNYLKALIELYRQDGSLLERRGITAPGREPVRLSN